MNRWAVFILMLALPAPAFAQEPPLLQPDAIVTLLEGGELARAERELQRILAWSDDATARDLLGIALSRQGRLEEAEQQFSRATLLAPELLPPRQHLARLFLQQGRSEDALTELRGAARLGPLERDLALWLADVDLSLGNDTQAEEQLRSVAERFGSVSALLELSRLYGRKGLAAIAAEIIERAMALAPNSEEVLTARAKLSLAVQAPVPAIKALESLIRMHPTTSEHNYLLGVARLQIGEMAGSVEALQRSLELEPDRPLTLIALGTTLNAQKRFDDAKEVARQAVRLDPESAEALAALAEAEEGLGEIDAAEEHANLTLALQPEHFKALGAIGRIRMSQERYEEARDIFLRAIASMPGSAKTHYQLSLAFARLGDREASRQHLGLYRRFRKESEERLVEMRTRAGFGNSGMGRP
jgi:tetratricopeptide (TPR) repeat protein